MSSTQYWQVPSLQERHQQPIVMCPVVGCGVKYNCTSNTDKMKKHVTKTHPAITILHRKRKSTPKKAELKRDRSRRYKNHASDISTKGYEKRWLQKCIDFVSSEQDQLLKEYRKSLAAYDCAYSPRPPRPLFTQDQQFNLRSVAFTYDRLRFAAHYDFGQDELLDKSCLSGGAWKKRWMHITLLGHQDRQQPTNERLKAIPQFSAEEFELAESMDDHGNVTAVAYVPYTVIQNAIEHWRSLNESEREEEFFCKMSEVYRLELKRHLEHQTPPRPMFKSLTPTEIEMEARSICDRMRRFYSKGKTPQVSRITEKQIVEKVMEEANLDGVVYE
ncbi:hypothetical protein BCR33DRAFT_768112, partial [Rhizoclosmatium globosum]